MRKWALLLAVCVVVSLSLGCAAGYYRTPVQPAGGWAFARLEAPMSTNFDQGAMISPKTGMATSESFLGFIALGDASLETAAKNGGISKIHCADYKFENILGLYSKFTTVVHGE